MRATGRRDTVISIDLSDYIDDLDEALDTQDALYVRSKLEEARRCLNRPERSAAEALLHVEDALRVVVRALPYEGHR